MKSELYIKRRAPKQKFRTKVLMNSGKGELVIGSKPALEWLQRQFGRKLNVVRTMHTRYEWVFCGLRQGV